MKRFTQQGGRPWGTFVHWKANAPTVLSNELSRLKSRTDTVLLSSVTDCYQPIERKLCITRACLEVLQKYDPVVSILTKSSMASRDFDILARFTQIEFGVSIGVLDERTSSILEPRADPPSERLELLRATREFGLKTYVFISPIHPHLTNLPAIMNRLVGLVDYVMAETINVRCGNWMDLSSVLPSLDITPEEYRNKAKSQTWIAEQATTFSELCQQLKLQSAGFYAHGQNQILYNDTVH
jgi:DNA repair photolyase